MSNLEAIRLPDITLIRVHEKDDGSKFVTSSGRNGQLFYKGTDRRDMKPFKEGFKSFQSTVKIKHYAERVSKLSYLSHIVAEHGLCKEAYRDYKRLMLVCFTTHIVNLRRLIRRTTARCVRSRVSEDRLRPRNPPVCTKHKQEYPSFTGETKSHVNVGVEVPLWTFKRFYPEP